MYTYKFCTSEKERNDLLDRIKGHHHIYWTGCFGNIENIQCERIDYCDIHGHVILGTILYMQHPEGKFTHFDEIRKQINEDCRSGKYLAY